MVGHYLDYQPANVLLKRVGDWVDGRGFTVKLSDFGLAKVWELGYCTISYNACRLRGICMAVLNFIPVKTFPVPVFQVLDRSASLVAEGRKHTHSGTVTHVAPEAFSGVLCMFMHCQAALLSSTAIHVCDWIHCYAYLDKSCIAEGLSKCKKSQKIIYYYEII